MEVITSKRCSEEIEGNGLRRYRCCECAWSALSCQSAGRRASSSEFDKGATEVKHARTSPFDNALGTWEVAFKDFQNMQKMPHAGNRLK
jgi:hypothetical protein